MAQEWLCRHLLDNSVAAVVLNYKLAEAAKGSLSMPTKAVKTAE